MPFFRRPPTDPAIAAARKAFAPVAAAIDQAQRALLEAIPTSRDEGVPLGQAIATFGSALARAREAMPAWRAPELEAAWRACAQAIDEAAAEAERLRLEPGALGFEALNGRVGDVLHPLERFAEVEQALRRGRFPRLA